MLPNLKFSKPSLLLELVALTLVTSLAACGGGETSIPTPDIPATVAVAVQEALPTPEPTPNIPATVAVAVQEALPTPEPTPDIPATVAVAVQEALPTPEPTPDIPATVAAVLVEMIPTSTPSSKATPEVAESESDEIMRQYSEPPLLILEAGVEYSAEIQTNLGNIRVALFTEEAPITVNNFLFLASKRFYDGVIFHRVIPAFMIQGGDPTGVGVDGPGYQFQDEISPSLNFDNPGVLAMANAGPDTNGSQFFITVAPTPHLTGSHTIFGRVVEGQDIANAIATVPTDGRDRPLEDVVIEGILLTEVR